MSDTALASAPIGAVDEEYWSEDTGRNGPNAKPSSLPLAGMSGCLECGTRRTIDSRECRSCNHSFCPPHLDSHDCDDFQGAAANEIEAGPQVNATTEQPAAEGGSGRFIGGAILLATGAVLTVSVVGAVVGVPLAMLGFGVMFPRFTVAMVALSVVSFFLLLAMVL